MKLNEPTKAETEFLIGFYGKNYIESVKVVKGKEKLFIFRNPSDFRSLSQKQIEVLFQLELEKELETPIFVDIEDGILCVE